MARRLAVAKIQGNAIAKRLAIAQSGEKMLLPDVWQQHNLGDFAATRRLSVI